MTSLHPLFFLASTPSEGGINLEKVFETLGISHPWLFILAVVGVFAIRGAWEFWMQKRQHLKEIEIKEKEHKHETDLRNQQVKSDVEKKSHKDHLKAIESLFKFSIKFSKPALDEAEKSKEFLKLLNPVLELNKALVFASTKLPNRQSDVATIITELATIKDWVEGRGVEATKKDNSYNDLIQKVNAIRKDLLDVFTNLGTSSSSVSKSSSS